MFSVATLLTFSWFSQQALKDDGGVPAAYSSFSACGSLPANRVRRRCRF